MPFEGEVIETLRENENTLKCITTKEKNVKHIVKNVPGINKVYFKTFYVFKCQEVYYCER